MLRKSTLLALAASAALGLAALAPTSASAHGGHGGGGHGGGGMHMGGGHGGGHGGCGHWGGHGGRHFGHNHYHWRYTHYRRPIWVARPVVYTGGYTVARPITPGPCTCLTKEYTPEGAVLFKDRCTNEEALNPPPTQTGELVAPNGPVAK